MAQVSDRVRKIQMFARDTPGAFEGYLVDTGMQMWPISSDGCIFTRQLT